MIVRAHWLKLSSLNGKASFGYSLNYRRKQQRSLQRVYFYSFTCVLHALGIFVQFLRDKRYFAYFFCKPYILYSTYTELQSHFLHKIKRSFYYLVQFLTALALFEEASQNFQLHHHHQLILCVSTATSRHGPFQSNAPCHDLPYAITCYTFRALLLKSA